MEEVTTLGASRRPTQERSRKKVERILASTAILLSNDKQNEITVRDIAQHAGVPIGTIYQFFDDREAIFDELGRQFRLVLTEAVASQLSADLLRQDIQVYVEKLVGIVDRVQASHNGFVCIWRETNTPALSTLAKEVRENLMCMISDHLAEAFPEVSAGHRELSLTVFEGAFVSAVASLPPKGSRGRRAYLKTIGELLIPFLKVRFSQ